MDKAPKKPILIVGKQNPGQRVFEFLKAFGLNPLFKIPDTEMDEDGRTSFKRMDHGSGSFKQNQRKQRRLSSRRRSRA